MLITTHQEVYILRRTEKKAGLDRGSFYNHRKCLSLDTAAIVEINAHTLLIGKPQWYKVFVKKTLELRGGMVELGYTTGK